MIGSGRLDVQWAAAQANAASELAGSTAYVHDPFEGSVVSGTQ
jgi:hypothetical protein